MTTRLQGVFFDPGDTIMVEETQVQDADRNTVRAEPFPGMADALRSLKARGYRLALVADTRPGTYRNVLRQHGLFEVFGCFAISEELGVEKPHPRMFPHALEHPGLAPAQAAMCGNNLAWDIAGADAPGITSIWTHWNYRYPTVPRNPLEHPSYTVRSAAQLLALIEHLAGGGREAGDRLASS